jgi:signal transduction histidine kinase/ActR/RegA family two-component response regulator
LLEAANLFCGKVAASSIASRHLELRMHELHEAPSNKEQASTAKPLDAAHHILIETARQLGSSLDRGAVFTRLRDSVSVAMRCDGLIVSSFDRAEGLIRCAYAWVNGNLVDPVTLPPLTYQGGSVGMQSRVIHSGKPMMFTNVVEHVRDPQATYYELDDSGGIRNLRASTPACRSAIMVPLRLEGAVVGVVQVMADAENVYSAGDLELLEGISLLLAVALENARLYALAQDEIEERRRTEETLRETEEHLREANLRKDEFLATLGHELRNPLNPIRSAIELLRRKGTNDADQAWGHDLIDRQVSHLARLIDDLLDVSRIRQGKLELRPRPVDVNEVMARCVESTRPTFEAAAQRITLKNAEGALYLNADPVRLAQIFSNLLDNAAKYSGTGGCIEVEVVRQQGDALIAVTDNGAGIAAEHLPRLFDLFYQADRSMGRAQGGLGIGLTLVKRLVEMHGGSIEAKSEGVGSGSRFEVRMPLFISDPRQQGLDSLEKRLSRPVHVLIADDNRDSANSMARLLRWNGNEVEIAYDGEDALRLAEAKRPEVMLLDIGMPRLDGYQLAERIRAQAWGRRMILIAATGWGQDEDRRRSLTSGFDAHLVKPVDPEALFDLIARLTAPVSNS